MCLLLHGYMNGVWKTFLSYSVRDGGQEDSSVNGRSRAATQEPCWVKRRNPVSQRSTRICSILVKLDRCSQQAGVDDTPKWSNIIPKHAAFYFILSYLVLLLIRKLAQQLRVTDTVTHTLTTVSTPVPDSWTLSSYLCGHRAHMWRTDMQAGKIPTHNWLEIFSIKRRKYDKSSRT